MKDITKYCMTRALTLLCALMLLTGCVTDQVLNYALKRDAEKEVKSYATAFAKQSHRRDSLWMSAFRDTVIISEMSKAKLHAIYRFADQPTRKTCLLLHGYKGNSLTMLDIAKFYSKELGCNVILPDFYAHGLSEGKMRQMGWLDRWDMIQWIRLANHLFSLNGKDTEMIVTGVSMGGATTMMISGEVDSQHLTYIKCFVEDCGYTNVYDQFSHIAKGKYGWLLNKTDRRCKKKYGWGFKEASAVEQVKKCNIPMLFIHGGADTFVPTPMVNEVYESMLGEKELWVPEGVGHAAAFTTRNAEYKKRVKNFVEKYLSK